MADRGDQAANQPPFLIYEDFVPLDSVRRELKRQLYVLLERITDVHFPWALSPGPPNPMVEQILADDSAPDKAQTELVKSGAYLHPRLIGRPDFFV